MRACAGQLVSHCGRPVKLLQGHNSAVAWAAQRLRRFHLGRRWAHQLPLQLQVTQNPVQQASSSTCHGTFADALLPARRRRARRQSSRGPAPMPGPAKWRPPAACASTLHRAARRGLPHTTSTPALAAPPPARRLRTADEAWSQLLHWHVCCADARKGRVLPPYTAAVFRARAVQQPAAGVRTRDLCSNVAKIG